MNHLLDLNVNVNEPLGLGDALSTGGSVILLGMLTVFAVLIILWFALSLFKFFFHDLKLGTKIVKKESAPKPVQPAPAPVVVAPADEEIVAVIAAAIAAAESEAPSGVKFRVVGFRRK